MTDTPDPAIPPAPPPLALQLVHDFAQKGLTTLAASLATGGVLSGDQTTQFATIGSAVILYGFSCLWTIVAAKVRYARLKAAIRRRAPEDPAARMKAMRGHPAVTGRA